MRPDLAAFLVLLVVAVATMPLYAIRRHRVRVDALESSARGTFVLGGFVRAWFYWFIGPVERASLALGLGPLFYNLAGVAFGIAAGAAFATGWLVGGGWALLLGGTADVLDGRIARARGLASRRGAFLDSTLDRFAEVGALAGLAILYRDSAVGAALVAAALGGSLLVSYARARGESVGVVCTTGLMQRAERLLMLGLGGLLDPVVSAATGLGDGIFLLALVGIIAMGTVGTAVYRTAWIARRLPRIDPRAGGRSEMSEPPS